MEIFQTPSGSPDRGFHHVVSGKDIWKMAIRVPMQGDEKKRQWSGLLLVLGGLALVTALEAALVRNFFMVALLAAAGSLLLIIGWITRRRTGQQPSTSQIKTK
jgi:hypothetical protein